MPKYDVPDSDLSRLSFMNQAITVAAAVPIGGVKYINDALLADLTAHHTAYRAAYDDATKALGKRKTETAESAAAMAHMQMCISHLWTAVYNRAQREKQDVGLLAYYKLTSDGGRPAIRKRQDWLTTAQSVIKGDEEAVVDGYPPAVNPSAVDVQAAYTTAMSEFTDVPLADGVYDRAQAAVAELRPRADALIKAVRAGILYATYEMDAASQRRGLRNYGASFSYLPGETVDDGDETAIVVE